MATDRGPRFGETELGGAERSFATTQWSALLGRDTEKRQGALAHLARHYWKPIYAYVRARRGCPNEEAKDLTQQFFLWMMESGFLDRLEPGRGHFRGFLKRALANFLTDRHRAGARKKRGGGARVLGLDLSDEIAHEPSDPREGPERVLDRRWREAVVQRAVGDVGAAFRAKGKGPWVDLWEAYDLAPEGSGVDHAALAERFGVTRREVAHWLASVRRAFREAVVAIVAETVGDKESLERELSELFSPGLR